MDVCEICGRPAECEHHLIFGFSQRRLCEEDHITIMMCNSCHNMADQICDRIHGNSMAEKLSKMLGQAIWEKEFIIDLGESVGINTPQDTRDYARDAFIQRYGRSYL